VLLHESDLRKITVTPQVLNGNIVGDRLSIGFDSVPDSVDGELLRMVDVESVSK
jgi:hypothetical protein